MKILAHAVPILVLLLTGYCSDAAAKEFVPAVAPAPADKPKADARKAEVEWGGKWWAATVVKTLGDKYYIHYDNDSADWDEWVGKDRIRFVGDRKAEPKVEVIWGERWWLATVLKTEGKRYYIRYDGWGDSSNEWVGKDRIYFPTGKAPDAKAADVRKAEVEWGGKWWPATVLKTEGGKYYIRYDGYSDNSNEWVGKERIRFPDKQTDSKNLKKQPKSPKEKDSK
jgi:hypothetical protein